MKYLLRKILGGLIVLAPIILWIKTYTSYDCIFGGCHLDLGMFIVGGLIVCVGLWFVFGNPKEKEEDEG